MSRYFFNLEGDRNSALDLVGRDLIDDQAAKSEAARFAADFGTTDGIGGPLGYHWIEVLDSSQRPVLRVPIGHANDEPNRQH